MSPARSSIRLNGEQRVLDCAVVAELLRGLGHAGQAPGIAVAVNGEVVPRAEWASHTLRPGDVVDVVGAAQGG